MFELGFLACLWPNVSGTCITSFMIEYLKPIYFIWNLDTGNAQL